MKQNTCSNETLLENMALQILKKDFVTYCHSSMVQSYTMIIGKLVSLDKKNISLFRNIGFLHDIGKIKIHNSILKKCGPLNHSEYTEMQKHTYYGFEILLRLNEFDMAEAVLHHHERWDGKGYPDGLSKDNISFASRVIAIADAFDAMVNQRFYRIPLPVTQALEEIKNNAGTQFDPYLANLFVSYMQ